MARESEDFKVTYAHLRGEGLHKDISTTIKHYLDKTVLREEQRKKNKTLGSIYKPKMENNNENGGISDEQKDSPGIEPTSE